MKRLQRWKEREKRNKKSSKVGIIEGIEREERGRQNKYAPMGSAQKRVKVTFHCKLEITSDIPLSGVAETLREASPRWGSVTLIWASLPYGLGPKLMKRGGAQKSLPFSLPFSSSVSEM